ncbi:Protein of unknown function [Gryllus bimaculatus]|nr:Protein of unknown function [Gryllus bimaculatus]
MEWHFVERANQQEEPSESRCTEDNKFRNYDRNPVLQGLHLMLHVNGIKLPQRSFKTFRASSHELVDYFSWKENDGIRTLMSRSYIGNSYSGWAGYRR